MHAHAYSLTHAHTHACTFFCNVYLSYSHSLHIHAYVNISDVLFLCVCLVVRPSLIWLYVCYLLSCVRLFICLSACVRVGWSVCLSVCLSVCMSKFSCLSLCPSLCRCVCTYVRLYACTHTFMHVRIFIHRQCKSVFSFSLSAITYIIWLCPCLLRVY